MSEIYQNEWSMDIKQADQIAMSPYIQSEQFCLVNQAEDTPFGNINRWYLLQLETGTKEKVNLKPTPCLAGKALVAAEGQFFYYQDQYPRRAFMAFEPQEKTSRSVGSVSRMVGSFQADGEWIVYIPEPEVGSLDQAEEFCFLNWKDGKEKTLTSTGVFTGRLPAKRHQNWYFQQEKLFFICESDSWTDSNGQSLKGCLACYDMQEERIIKLAELADGFDLKNMLLQEETLWMLGFVGQERLLYAVFLKTGAGKELQPVLRLTHDSYDQIVDIQLCPQGLFWFEKEIQSLLQSASSLWWFDFKQQERILMIRLAEFRELNLQFQPVGKWLYYQDEFWKEPSRTALDEPLVREKVTGDSAAEKP